MKIPSGLHISLASEGYRPRVAALASQHLVSGGFGLLPAQKWSFVDVHRQPLSCAKFRLLRDHHYRLSATTNLLQFSKSKILFTVFFMQVIAKQHSKAFSFWFKDATYNWRAGRYYTAPYIGCNGHV